MKARVLRRHGIPMDYPRAPVAIALGLALIMGTPVALAAPTNRTLAKEAYQRAVDAHSRADYRVAAEEFARADALAPDATALQAALDATLQTDDAVLGAELLERSARAPTSGSLATTIASARARFAGRAGRLRVICPDHKTCLAMLDGVAIETARPVWAKVGRHTVVLQLDGEAQTKLVDVSASSRILEITPKTPKDPDGKVGVSLPPLVFFLGAGATIVLASGGVAFGLFAKEAHDDFRNGGCESVVKPGCTDLKESGESRQVVANALWVSAGAVGLLSAVVGLGFTHWRGRSKTGLVISPTTGGAFAGYSGLF